MRLARLAGRLAGLASALWFVGVGGAHGGGLRGATRETLTAPTWLVLLTGGGVVGASFLLASFATDRAFVAGVHRWRRAVPAPRRALGWAGRLLGLAALALVVWTGLFGPADPLRNAAILLIWAGWWAGLAMATYLVGDAWPALDPVRTLAGVAGDGHLDYPEWLGAWPSAVALLALVYVEVVSPLAERPRLLAALILGYVAASTAGAVLVGRERWAASVDPVSGVFRTYGLLAPVQRTPSGLQLAVPGSGLATVDLGRGEVAFVLALLWGTTFDGLVATLAWARAVPRVVAAGVPPGAVYLGGLAGGFALAVGVYRLAARLVRRTAPTYRTPGSIARTFAPALVPIAAGYHLAHYLGYFLELAPALASALAAPLSPPSPVLLVLPGWFGAVGPLAVLAGHVLAVWVAHGIAFETFPGRLQAIRSQYPLTAAMVLYTVTSLWIVIQPQVTPPYL